MSAIMVFLYSAKIHVGSHRLTPHFPMYGFVQLHARFIPVSERCEEVGPLGVGVRMVEDGVCFPIDWLVITVDLGKPTPS